MSDTFCVYPWINLHSNTDGRCKLCCHIYEENYFIDSSSENKNPELILGRSEFETIWNGDYISRVRQKMLAGEKVAECERCYQHERAGLESSRQWANKTYGKGDQFDASASQAPPRHLELRLGNICNLKCNSCWSVSSQSIYKERKRALETKEIPQWLKAQWQHEVDSVEDFDWSWYKTDEFKRFIKRVCPQLERLYLTGGEPTMIEENYEILQELVKCGNHSCYVAWTTNLTHWPDKYYKILQQFDASEVQLSLDGYGDSAHYIRYPSYWEKLERNFERALELPRKVQLKVYCVVQAWNLSELPEIMKWISRKCGGRRVDFVPIFLEYPDQIHCCVWPVEFIDRVMSDLKSFIPGEFSGPAVAIIDYLEANKNRFGVDERKRMKEFIQINDEMRKIRFEDYFPELHGLLAEDAI